MLSCNALLKKKSYYRINFRCAITALDNADEISPEEEGQVLEWSSARVEE